VTLRVLSLFAGIGGFDLGLERAGMKVVGQCEIDPFCRKVLRKHWPDVWLHDDVRTLTGDMVREHCGQVDVICGGYPCQGESVAGNRKGVEDDRWLWPHYFRLLGELRPRFALLENVANHLRESFHVVAGDLAGAGYDVQWVTLCAADVGGQFQGRRLFGVAAPRSERVPRYFPDERPLKVGQRWPSGKARLLDAIHDPFGRSDCLGTPVLCRNTDGVPNRLDRLHALGNAIVPQCAEWIGRCVLDALAAEKTGATARDVERALTAQVTASESR
jgi:DNA (cytosine-5)-methyltransferase 1